MLWFFSLNFYFCQILLYVKEWVGGGRSCFFCTLTQRRTINWALLHATPFPASHTRAVTTQNLPWKEKTTAGVHPFLSRSTCDTDKDGCEWAIILRQEAVRFEPQLQAEQAVLGVTSKGIHKAAPHQLCFLGPWWVPLLEQQHLGSSCGEEDGGRKVWHAAAVLSPSSSTTTIIPSTSCDSSWTFSVLIDFWATDEAVGPSKQEIVPLTKKKERNNAWLYAPKLSELSFGFGGCALDLERQTLDFCFFLGQVFD
jgi:hypothetical protein